jgi:hypothetical protein
MASPGTVALAASRPQALPAPSAELQPDHQRDRADESLYLIGRPPLDRLLSFARNQGVNPPGEGRLVEVWNAARERVRQLEKDEAGLADNPPLLPLGPEYEPLLVDFLKDPLVRGGFNTVPTDVVLVELDSLVVSQRHIDLTFARRLAGRLGPAPSRDALFRTCLPFDHPRPPVNWSRMDRDKFVFVSPSNDLRFLGSMPMEAGHVTGSPPPGVVVGVVGLAVGFGSNFLNAIHVEGRLILNNGSHRAYALRAMGITHVPCIVQHASSREELSLVASSEVRRHPDRFLKNVRPSMLRDYFDPKLHVVLPVHRRVRQVTVRFTVHEEYVPVV